MSLMMAFSKIHCIIDCSGSMAEYGKPMLMVNLLRYIRQSTRLDNKDIHYFSWQESITEMTWSDEEDVELPIAEGKGDTTVLCNWAEKNSDVNLLVLTDGYFELNILQCQQLVQIDHFYLIGVGGDADFSRLKTLSDYYYRAEQLDLALQLIYRMESTVRAPKSRVDLTKTIEKTSEDSDDDEW